MKVPEHLWDLKAAGIECVEVDAHRYCSEHVCVARGVVCPYLSVCDETFDSSAHVAARNIADAAIEALKHIAIALKSERDRLQHYIDCANTPLMVDVLRERDEAIAARDLAHAHILQLETERDALRRQLGD
jgi:hypothetical protein